MGGQPLKVPQAWQAYGAWLASHEAELGPGTKERFAYAKMVNRETADRARSHMESIRGRVRAVVPAPHDDATRELCKMVLEKVYPASAPGAGSLTLDEIDGVLLVASWFRRHRP